MYFNDEPATLKNGHGSIMPICQVGGGGGRAAEIIAQGFSCEEPTCVNPKGKHHKLIWDDKTFMPELKLGAMGGVCEEPCALLNYAQCAKAADMGLIDALTGGYVIHEMFHRTHGTSHAAGTMASGCNTNGNGASAQFNSIDTPSGIHAAPGTDGDAWVTPSGVGVGYSRLRPVCGDCSIDPNAVNDDAAAVGDPHMQTANGEKFDLAEPSLNH